MPDVLLNVLDDHLLRVLLLLLHRSLLALEDEEVVLHHLVRPICVMIARGF